jgi:hypothetical protein
MLKRIFSLHFLELDHDFVFLHNELGFLWDDIFVKIVFDQSIVLPIQIRDLRKARQGERSVRGAGRALQLNQKKKL